MSALETCLRDAPENISAKQWAEMVHARTSSGATALHLTIVGTESLESIQFLLDLGLDPNSANIYGETPLFWAVQKAQPDTISTLVQHGANVNACDGGNIYSRVFGRLNWKLT